MTDSVIDARFTLRDLLDLGVLRDVLETYSKCFEVKITIINEDGKEILTACPDDDFCKAVQSSPLQNKCKEVNDRLYKYPLEGSKVLQNKTFCQMRYAVFALTYQLDTLGRVIIGPFYDPELSPEQILATLGELGKNPATIDQIKKIPAIFQERLITIIKLLSKILNSFLFINAKRLITTRLHLEHIYSSSEETFRQVELQDSGSEEDRAEIKKLKNMF